MFLVQKLSRWPPFFILEMGFASIEPQLCWILLKNVGNFSHDGNTLKGEFVELQSLLKF